jgi:hypothetical protein
MDALVINISTIPPPYRQSESKLQIPNPSFHVCSTDRMDAEDDERTPIPAESMKGRARKEGVCHLCDGDGGGSTVVSEGRGDWLYCLRSIGPNYKETVSRYSAGRGADSVG